MTSQPEKQTIAIHILPNISRSKRNQAIKFGQFIEYNMRPIFLEKSYLVCVKKLFPDPFLENQIISGSIVFQSLFFLYIKLRAFTSYEDFLKNKKRSYYLIFCIISEKRYFP